MKQGSKSAQMLVGFCVHTGLCFLFSAATSPMLMDRCIHESEEGSLGRRQELCRSIGALCGCRKMIREWSDKVEFI